MSRMHRRPVLAALLLAGCASGSAEVKTPSTIPQQQCPKVDVARISEISDIDRENQQEISKVNDLEKRLGALQERLSSAVRPSNEAQKESVTVSSTGSKVRVRLSDELLFRPASARISEAGRKALEQVASVLKDSPSKRIEIAGHTDNLPITIKKYENNWELSMERARRVGSYLIAQGVDPKKLVMSGYADNEPLEAGDTDEARAKNRRVEIFIEPTGSDASAH
jgi:chemotaxis protein MotB